MSDRSFDCDADNEAAYDGRIYPLMAQIIAVCQELNIPFVASFQYAEEDFCSSAWLPKGCHQALSRAYKNLLGEDPSFAAFTITTERK